MNKMKLAVLAAAAVMTAGDDGGHFLGGGRLEQAE